MGSTIDHARRDVEREFACTLRHAESCGALAFWTFERELWTMLLALGRALVGLFLARRAYRLRKTTYEHPGGKYSLSDSRSSQLGTRFGKVSFTRPIGRRVGRSE